MKLIGTVLRCSARKVNSSSKETYVTNLLVLDPENSGGTNYAVEVWDDKPHQVTPMSEVALTVVGVVNKNGESSPRFPAQGVTAEIPLTIPLPPIPRDESSGMSTGMGDPSPTRMSQGNHAVS